MEVKSQTYCCRKRWVSILILQTVFSYHTYQDTIHTTLTKLKIEPDDPSINPTNECPVPCLTTKTMVKQATSFRAQISKHLLCLTKNHLSFCHDFLMLDLILLPCFGYLYSVFLIGEYLEMSNKAQSF